MSSYYNEFKKIEEKWISFANENNLFKQLENSDLPKYYCLEMFVYPSGNLHMGHVRNYSIGDALARYKQANGFNVLHPVSWDSFGLPAENAAIEHNKNPEEWTLENVKKMKSQFKRLHFFYDWNNSFMTSNEDYYKWGQWLFIQMYKKGLIYQKKSPVNWCPKCNTVLANEQVNNGYCWRHPHQEIEKKNLKQWYIKITDYAQRLLDGHKQLEKTWPSEVISMQKNWIGKSNGVVVNFKHNNDNFPIFTTRVDTLYGVTFLAIAFDHPYLEKYIDSGIDKDELDLFIKKCQQTNQLENYEKEGFFSGNYIEHPLTHEKLPLYIANFVLSEYGSGAIMCVPAHDQRDFLFAKKYNIPIKTVIQNKEKNLDTNLTEVYLDKGVLINSENFNSLSRDKAVEEITKFIEKKKIGYTSSQYKLKDWLISRQRYWGNPIPMIHCSTCGIIPEKEENLPIKLPKDVQFNTQGNPIETSTSFLKTDCPKCGKTAKRETDTMDTFFCSSWYFLRNIDPNNQEKIFDKKKIKHWIPVDKYIGGIEHACMHLLYARFMQKVLIDMSWVSHDEPFSSLLTQGMVLSPSYYNKVNSQYYSAEEFEALNKQEKKDFIIKTEKMGKSKKNGIDPNKVIDLYGSDTTRLFILFAAPPQKKLEWNDNAIEGCFKFLKKLWNFGHKVKQLQLEKHSTNNTTPQYEDILKKYHKTIKKVNKSTNDLNLNIAISSLMEFFNSLNQHPIEKENINDILIILKGFLKLLNPFTPCITEEINSFFDSQILWHQPYPTHNPKYIEDEIITYVIQINGKLRNKLIVSKDTPKDTIIQLSKNDDTIKKWLKDKEIIKEIFVPSKLINFVIQ